VNRSEQNFARERNEAGASNGGNGNGTHQDMEFAPEDGPAPEHGGAEQEIETLLVRIHHLERNLAAELKRNHDLVVRCAAAERDKAMITEKKPPVRTVERPK
jgi:hypothetical protein